MGIRDKPIAPGSPWQNGFAERLIGSIRRECVDHLIVMGETHLRRVLKSYASYYNEMRTHRSLDKDAPLSRLVQRTGSIVSHALLGGLHTSTFECEFLVHTAGRSHPLVQLDTRGDGSIGVPLVGGSLELLHLVQLAHPARRADYL